MLVRDQGFGRLSDSVGFIRLPVLEEQLTRVEEGQSRNEEILSESEEVYNSPDQIIDVLDRSVIVSTTPAAVTSTITVTTTATTSSVIAPENDPGPNVSSSQSPSGDQDQLIKRRPEKLQTTRPLSTSATPNSLTSPGLLTPSSVGDASRMFLSEITFKRELDKEASTRHSVSSTPFPIHTNEPDSTERSHSLTPASTTLAGQSMPLTTDAVAFPSQSPTPLSSPPPLPPLIPRSPVFSGLLGMREDPPLELPILPQVKKVT